MNRDRKSSNLINIIHYDETGAVSIDNTVESTGFKVTGGLSTGFLKADGSVDYTTTGGGSGSAYSTAYDNTITGLKNGVNTVFTLPIAFQSGSTHVYLNGLRMSRGASYDYTETSTTQITFNYALNAGDILLVDYIP